MNSVAPALRTGLRERGSWAGEAVRLQATLHRVGDLPRPAVSHPAPPRLWLQHSGFCSLGSLRAWHRQPTPYHPPPPFTIPLLGASGSRGHGCLAGGRSEEAGTLGMRCADTQTQAPTHTCKTDRQTDRQDRQTQTLPRLPARLSTRSALSARVSIPPFLPDQPSRPCTCAVLYCTARTHARTHARACLPACLPAARSGQPPVPSLSCRTAPHAQLPSCPVSLPRHHLGYTADALCVPYFLPPWCTPPLVHCNVHPGLRRDVNSTGDGGTPKSDSLNRTGCFPPFVRVVPLVHAPAPAPAPTPALPRPSRFRTHIRQRRRRRVQRHWLEAAWYVETQRTRI